MALDRLEAVNRLLSAIGETPVNSLDSGLPDAEDAEQFLDRKTADILAEGWHCNTDHDVLTAPNVNGHIPVAPDWLRADPSGRDALVFNDVVQRTDPSDEIIKLFRKKTQSFVFTGPLRLVIVRSLPFDALPYNLRRHIVAQAAGDYQKSRLGSRSLSAELQDEQMKAMAEVGGEECDLAGYNALRDNPDAQYIAKRNHPYFGFN
jgi:hypothetical protein